MTVQSIDVVVPVCNEGRSIEKTLRGCYRDISELARINVRFVVCDDGSRDNTTEVLERLQTELPLLLITSRERKGYSRAVIDGLKASQSDIVGFMDGDGQYNPKEFPRLLEALKDCDLAIGYRNPRADHWIRLCMSFAFKCAFRIFFTCPLKDPSCSYVLIRRSLLTKALAGNVGVLKQGFWWEFLARSIHAGAKINEVPVSHYKRADGATLIYKPAKVPRIAYEHILGLFILKKELR